MNKFLSIGAKLYSLPAILLVGIALKLFRYTAYPPFWDACSFILIGKNILSSGQVGLLEPFRPLVWPIVLGFFWKIGWDPIVCGRLVELIVGIAQIGLVYLIGKDVYGKPTGLLAALFLSLSPTFFIWGNSLCSDVFASGLSLLAFYSLARKKFLWVGIIGGLALFSKFPLAVVIAVLGLSVIVFGDVIRQPRNFLNVVLGAGGIFVVFFVLFRVLYGDVLMPYKDGALSYPYFLTDWPVGMSKALRLLITEENWFLVFSLVGVWSSFFQQPSKEKWSVGWISILSLLWIGKFAVDHHRLSVTVLPYLFLLSAAGIIVVVNVLRERKLFFLRNVMILAVVASSIFQLATIQRMRFPENRLNVLQQYVRKSESQLQGRIWISNPNQLVFSNLKAEELMYHPVFTGERAKQLLEKLRKADFIILDSRDLLCRAPDNVTRCRDLKQELIAQIKTNFTAELLVEDSRDGTVIGVFSARQ